MCKGPKVATVLPVGVIAEELQFNHAIDVYDMSGLFKVSSAQATDPVLVSRRYTLVKRVFCVQYRKWLGIMLLHCGAVQMQATRQTPSWWSGISSLL